MSYLRLTPYLYLIVAIFCLYDGIANWEIPDSNYEMSLIIAGVAIFMFAFRLSFAKRIEKRNRERKN